METLNVDKKYDQKKLSKYLLNNIPNLNINAFYKLIRKKDIKINGVRTGKDVIISEGDEIIIYLPEGKNQVQINVVYEDKNILLINKQANLEVIGKNSLTTIVHEKYVETDFKPMPCHRLDRNTKGLILFAKNQETLDILLQKFRNHEIEKHYYALVYGVPNKKFERLEAYLFKDNKKSMVYISDVFKKGYQKIITSYKVLEEYDDNTSLLDVQIETGKTHQIRAHLAHIGYPIICDGKYGTNEVNKKYFGKFQKLQSYLIKFNFKEDSGILNYLNGKSFIIDNDIK